ncbi:MAG: hypothetical protein JXA57_07720, partial [Armatimonadetes bacterium]|nr:hypothetical protein [Armatimonadota bacterium]
MRPAASSRERMLAALDRASGASVPCCFMIFLALRAQCRDEFEFAARQVDLGLDTRVQIEDLPVRFSPDVSVQHWSDDGVLHRVYQTPAGTLTAAVRRTEDWPYGEHIPIFDDHFAPRAVKYPVTCPSDLPAFRYLLAAPCDEDIAAFRQQAAERRRFATDRGLLFSGGWKSQRFIQGEDSAFIGA